jgi:hypothetical protein
MESATLWMRHVLDREFEGEVTRAVLVCEVQTDTGPVVVYIPPRKDGRVRETRIWNDLVLRSGEMLDLAIHDLRQLAEREGHTLAAVE